VYLEENCWAAGVKVRHTSEPRDDKGNKKHENTIDKKRHQKAHWKNSGIWSFHSTIDRMKLTILQAVVCKEQDQLGPEEHEAF
jgi:hypothetical protein